MPADEPPPRYDFDLEIVMRYQLARAEAARLRGDAEARASAEATWRRAYFDSLRQGATRHEYPG